MTKNDGMKYLEDIASKAGFDLDKFEKQELRQLLEEDCSEAASLLLGSWLEEASHDDYHKPGGIHRDYHNRKGD